MDKHKKEKQMNANEDYRLLDHTGVTIAMGTQDQMFSYVKHHVPDGRYRIVGSDIKLHCLRKNGIVEPDLDGVQLEAKRINLTDLADTIPTDPPYGDD